MKLIHNLKKNIGLFQRAWNTKHFFLGFGLDVVTILLIVGFAFAFLLPLQAVSSELGSNDEQIQAEILNPEPDIALLSEYQSTTMSLLTKLVGYVVLFILTSLFVIVGSRLLMWRRITGTKAPSELLRRRIGRYISLYSFSLVVLIAVLAGFFLLIKTGFTSVAQLNAISANSTKMLSFKIFLEVLIPLVVIIGLNFFYVFAKTSKIFHSVKQSFSLLFQFFSFYIIPYLFVRLFFILRWPLYILFNRVVTWPWFNFALKLLVVLLIIAVGRLFLGKLIAVLYKRSLVTATHQNK